MSKMTDKQAMLELAPSVPLKELIKLSDERNYDGIYSLDCVRGIATAKQFINTKANMEGVSLFSYKIVKPKQFAFVADTSRRGDKISLSYNSSYDTYLVSSISTVFGVDESRINPSYLYLILCRPEFDRYARFNSWGSAREAFSFEEMERVQIPLPSLDVQKKYVDAYNGLQQLAEQNEALLTPLSQACHAFLADISSKYESVELGQYIEEMNERNDNGYFTVDDVRGVSIQKQLIDTKAKMDGVSVLNYKVIRPNYFVFNVNTARMGDKFAIALSTSNYIATSIYGVFKVKDENVIDPAYLFLFFDRAEFDRYVRFNSWGSARETFTMNEMNSVRVPLPPLDVQKSIVALLRCAEEARDIAAQARRTMREICPAMVQQAAHTNS